RLRYPVQEARVSPNGRWLACVSADRRVVVLDWPTAERIWQSDGHVNFAGSCRIACFSPCGRLLVTVAANDVRTMTVWSVGTGRIVGELRGHTRAILKA